MSVDTLAAPASDALVHVLASAEVPQSTLSALQPLWSTLRVTGADPARLRPLAGLLVEALNGRDALVADVAGVIAATLADLPARLAGLADALAEAGAPMVALALLERGRDHGAGPAAEIAFTHAALLRRHGHLDRALAVLRRCGSVPADRQADWSLLEAEILRGLQRHSEAEPLLRQVLAWRPDNRWVRLWLAEYAAGRADHAAVFDSLGQTIDAAVNPLSFTLFLTAAAELCRFDEIRRVEGRAASFIPAAQMSDLGTRIARILADKAAAWIAEDAASDSGDVPDWLLADMDDLVRRLIPIGAIETAEGLVRRAEAAGLTGAAAGSLEAARAVLDRIRAHADCLRLLAHDDPTMISLEQVQAIGRAVGMAGDPAGIAALLTESHLEGLVQAWALAVRRDDPCGTALDGLMAALAQRVDLAPALAGRLVDVPAADRTIAFIEAALEQPGAAVADLLVVLARAHGSAGRPDQARACFADLRARFAQDPATLVKLAESARLLRLMDEEQAFRWAVLDVLPADRHTRFRLAEFALEAGRFQQAYDLLLPFAAISPHPPTPAMFARAAYGIGRFDEARREINRALGIWPDVAKWREAAKEYSHAEAALTLAEEILGGTLPAGEEALATATATVLGIVHTARQDRALAALDRLEPGLPPASPLRGEVLKALRAGGRADAARRCAATILSAGDAAPDDLRAAAHECLGDWAARARALPEARMHYRSAAAALPTGAGAVARLKLERLDREATGPGRAVADNRPVVAGDRLQGRMVSLTEAAVYADRYYRFPRPGRLYEFDFDRHVRMDAQRGDHLDDEVAVFSDLFCGEFFLPILPSRGLAIEDATYKHLPTFGIGIKVDCGEFVYPVKPDIHRIEEPVFLIGGSPEKNYYHWTMNWMSRIFVAERAMMLDPDLRRFKFFVHENVREIPQFMEMLASLGIGGDRLIFGHAGGNYMFRTCAVPSFQRFNFFNDDILRQIRQRIGGLDDDRTADPRHGRRVFLSRQSTKAPKRRLHNFDAVAPVLAKHGFDVLEPQNYTVRQQAALINDCSIIMSTSGAALTNLVYAARGSRFLLLSPRYLVEHRTEKLWYGYARLLGFDIDIFITDRVRG